MFKRKLWIVVAVAGVGICLAAVGMAFGPPKSTNGEPPKGGNSKTEPAPKGPVAITTEAVSSRPVQRLVTVVGSLYGRDEVTVSAKVEGRVQQIHHDVGDEVRPGDVLIELDTTDAQLAVIEAQRGLELELAKLGLKEPPPESFGVNTLPAVSRAAAKDNYAKSRQERASKLKGSISEEDTQQIEFEARDAREAHRQAQLDAEATLAAVRQRQATLETSRQRLEDTRIVVSTPGTYQSGGQITYVIAQRSVSEGEMVRPGTVALFRLVVAESLKLQAAVSERHLGEVKVGQSVEIRVEAFPQEKFTGTVSRVNPTVDRTSRTFQVEVAVPNPKRRLAPGSFVKAEIQTRLDQGAILVPEEALVQFAGVTKVFIVRNGKASTIVVRPTEVRVEVGEPGRTRVMAEVSGNLHPGDQVVTSGQTKLTDGAAIKLRSETETGGVK